MPLFVPNLLGNPLCSTYLNSLGESPSTGTLTFDSGPAFRPLNLVTRERIPAFQGMGLSLLLAGRRLLDQERVVGDHAVSLDGCWRVSDFEPNLVLPKHQVVFSDKTSLWLKLGTLAFRRNDGRSIRVSAPHEDGPITVGVGWEADDAKAMQLLEVHADGRMRSRYELSFGPQALLGLARYLDLPGAESSLPTGGQFVLFIVAPEDSWDPMPLSPKCQYPFFHYAEHRALEKNMGDSRTWAGA